MKRLFALICAAVLMSVCLCSCMDNAAGKVKDKASEAVSDVKGIMEEATVKSDAHDKNNETVTPTNVDDSMIETIGDMIATEYDDMVENGKVDDGDGNVGDLENKDGDNNVDNEN